ncbi:DNA replication protein Orc1 [Halolamina litorea]|uniref:Cdc6/Cdc18 family protein n=1 Tax=Halolamina litorea TaxID=1515593 RepID=A0ABD6BUF5_9EURY|nr:AAA family ATPase [Halolamina litorea]
MYVAADKLEEHHLPRAMPGRERQLQRISNVLEPATEGKPAESCWEIGPSGVGKTSTAKYLLRELRWNWSIESEYVSCVSNTRWEALKKIADEHPSVLATQNTSTERLRELIAAPDEPFVVILDEIGGLEETALLSDLAGIEWLSLILIGHRRSNALGQIPDAVDYLRYSEIIEFDPYSHDALFTILAARREVALQHGVVDDRQLERIVAEAGGSARFGVQALRSAVDLGIDRGHTTVREEDLEDCFEHAHARIRKQQLESLGVNHQLVYRAIRQSGAVRPQEIFEGYEELGGSNTRQMVVQYRKKLDEYGLIQETPDGWVAVDETLAAPLREQRIA